MRVYGRRMRAGVHAQRVHDQIAKVLKDCGRVCLDFSDIESVGPTFVDTSLGALVALHGTAVLRSIVFAHCSPVVEASIVHALREAGPCQGLLQFSEEREGVI